MEYIKTSGCDQSPCDQNQVGYSNGLDISVTNGFSKKVFTGVAPKMLLAVATVLTLSACSSGGSAAEASGPEANSMPNETMTAAGPEATMDTNTGTSAGGSSALQGTWVACGNGFLLGYEFTASRWKEVKGLFPTEDCTGPVIPDSGLDEFEFEGTYNIVGTTTSSEGLEVLQIDMTSDALEGEALLPSAVVTRYNIIYTGMAGQLIFGEFTRNESARATELDFDIPYLRR